MQYFRADVSSLEVADCAGLQPLFDRDEHHVVQLEIDLHQVFLDHLDSCPWFSSLAFDRSMLLGVLNSF